MPRTPQLPALARLPAIVRVVVAIGVAIGGGTLGVVCLTSTAIQARSGFLASEPRLPLLILYALGTVVCIVVPTAVWPLLLPHHRRWGLILTLATIAVLSVPVLPLLLP